MQTFLARSARCLAPLVFAACALSSPPEGPAQAVESATVISPNRLLEDANIEGDQNVSADEVQAFLQANHSALATYAVNGRRAADWIVSQSRTASISPIYLLVRIQAESQLISSGTLTNVDQATGCACPDRAACDPAWAGFDRQVLCSANWFRGYLTELDQTGQTRSGWRVGVAKQTLDPCTVVPANRATAALYTYTPWVGQYADGCGSPGGGSSSIALIYRQYATAFPSAGGGAPPSDPRRDDGAGRVGRTPAGALEVLVRGGDNSIWRNRRAPAGGYDGWRPMHGTAKTEPLLVPNADGHFDAVVVQPDGVVAKSWQVAPDGAWVQDGQFFAMDMAAGLRVQSRPAYALNADGRVELFALTDQGRLAHAWQLEPNGSFSPWFELGVAGTFAGAPAATRNRDGRLEVFVRGGAFLYHAWQTQPGGAWTAGGQALPVADGRALATSPAAVTNADGRLEVFVTGDDGVIRHAWQGAPGGDFSLLYPLGPRTASSSPSVLLHADGRLEVFARGAGNEVEHTWQQAPGRDWAPDLYPFANRGFTGVPAAVERTDGRLEVFGRDVEGTLFVSHQRPDLGLDDFVPVP
jgi:hypothetical protein